MFESKRPITYTGTVVEKDCGECGRRFSSLRRTGPGPRYCEDCRETVMMRNRKRQNSKYSETRRVRKQIGGNVKKRKLIPYAGWDGSKSQDW